ncbi:hypothetical protein QR680_015253 [Steinernema hermaphroditum]|uniref:Uncharacterized protein n=1 Tax=Steinernema hermaphroditum TaxID=289476 RepID=A0AA39H7Z6_9BILA|nr:hypothetical protein QR680_015253 [Steinernema hermaphroditum]
MSPDDINKLTNYVLIGLLYSVAIFFLYIVVFKTPPSMRIYRNTITNVACCYIIVMTDFAILLQPVYATLPNKSCAKFSGLISYFGLEMNIAALFLSVILMENLALAIIICFIYRYDQMKCMNKASFMQSRKGLLLCILMHISVAIFSGCFTCIFLVVGEFVQYDGAFLYCIADEKHHIVQALSVLIGISLILETSVIVICAFLTIRRLSSLKTLMNKDTYRLNKLLTMNLVILVVLPIVFQLIPFCILCYAIYVRADSLYFWLSFACHIAFVDDILSLLAPLYFVTPYRRAIKSILCKNNVITVRTIAPKSSY